MFEAMQGSASVTEGPFTDEWGTFYSGYAPISQGGKVLGIVAVDYEASSIQTSLNSLIRNILLAVGTAVLFAVVAAFLVAIRMRRNFIKVNDKILEVASDDGDITKVLNITSGDELEVIGNSLNRLLEKTGKTVREIKSGTGSIETKMGNINTNVKDSAALTIPYIPWRLLPNRLQRLSELWANRLTLYLSELLVAIDGEMRSIETVAAETFSAVLAMNRELSGYQVWGVF